VTQNDLVTLGDDQELALPDRGDNKTIIGPKWIGNIRCFWPDADGKPRLTIGPNWGFTIILLAIVGGTLYTSTNALIGMWKKRAAWYFIVLGFTFIVLGIFAFLKTLLGDPGIPKEIYYRMARPFAKPEPKPDKDKRGFSLCEECQVYVTKNREHCELCNCCIDFPDHHCVFYSKCIGGGNVNYFRLSMLMFVINMTYFIIVYGIVSVHAEYKHK
jgi:hypothetical protein